MSKSRRNRVRKAFDRSALKRVCEMHETEFGHTYGAQVTHTPGLDGDFYAFVDNGSSILAVAHLDTVQPHHKRLCTFADTAGGPVVYSGALDDRLGAYTILELLPALGIRHDILLTTGEESGCSTAQFFEPPRDRFYNWVIEFDRGGSDVVMYQYEDRETEDLVRDAGAKVGSGSFSDIAYLEHLEVKCFNWGIGYRDYHSARGHAWLDETYDMVASYLRFHEQNAEVYLPHEQGSGRSSWWGGSSYGSYGSSYSGVGWGEVGKCPMCLGYDIDPDVNVCERCEFCLDCEEFVGDACLCRVPLVKAAALEQEKEDEQARLEAWLEAHREDDEPPASTSKALVRYDEGPGLLRSIN